MFSAMILRHCAINWSSKCFLAPACALPNWWALKDSDINIYEGTIKVLGKRNKERIIPVNNELKLLMAEYHGVKEKSKFS